MTESDSLSVSVEAVKQSLICTAASSQGFFRHQQKDEPDLNNEEKRQIVADLLAKKPALFLQRFGQFLTEHQLEYFDKSGDFHTEFYLKDARQQQCRIVREKRIRNRRYEAMKRMIEEGSDYFSEAEMKKRNPLLYEQLIGKYLTEEEKEQLSRPDLSNCRLSDMIMEHMSVNEEEERRKRQKEHEDFEEFDSESEDEEGDGGDSSDEREEVAAEEGGRDMLRREFVRAAYSSFLEGRDVGFDYGKVDRDQELDDLEVEERDAQDRYFDDD